MSESLKAKVWNGTTGTVKVGAPKFLLAPGQSMMVYLDDEVLSSVNAGLLVIAEMPKEQPASEPKKKKKEPVSSPEEETTQSETPPVIEEIIEEVPEDSILPKEDE